MKEGIFTRLFRGIMITIVGGVAIGIPLWLYFSVLLGA